MAGTFEVHDDGTITVAFSYTATAAKIQATADAAAHMLYNAGRKPKLQQDTGEVDDEGNPIVQKVVVPWDDLTNQEKLDMVDEMILERIRKLARGYLHDVRTADDEAKAAADEASVL